MKLNFKNVECSEYETFYIATYRGFPVIYRDRQTEIPIEKIITLASFTNMTPYSIEVDDRENNDVTDVIKVHCNSTAWYDINDYIKEIEDAKTKEYQEWSLPKKLIFRNNIWMVPFDKPEDQQKIMSLLLDRDKNNLSKF